MHLKGHYALHTTHISQHPGNPCSQPHRRTLREPGHRERHRLALRQRTSGFAGGAQFPVDLYEDKDNTYVRAELPGVARDAINVEMVDGSLSIHASRKEKTDSGESTISYSRLVSIPEEVQADKVAASYENGVLTVTLPRPEAAKPRKINVSVN